MRVLLGDSNIDNLSVFGKNVNTVSTGFLAALQSQRILPYDGIRGISVEI